LTRFLLVHGSCHGAWCWRDVLPFLNTSEVSATAIDLPGSGEDITPPGGVTLDDYARAITGILTEPTILVGHSAGGFAITAAAERDPSRIAGLIYLSAYIPAPGLSLADLRRAGPSQPLRGALILSDDRLTYRVDPAAARRLFYNDCPDDTASWAVSRLGPQPVLPQSVPLALSGASQTVPRHAILTTDDRTIPLDWQARMAAGLPPACVTTMPCGHSPFFAAPQDLARRLIAIARDMA
jgi:pimeloyl-ACP methyl ester carboxylesterase